MSRLDFPARIARLNDDPEGFTRWLDSLKPRGGVWTPDPTFATPGDFAATWSTQEGIWYRVGDLVTVFCNLVSSAFAHTTAAGNFRIGGLPFTAKSVSQTYSGACRFAGITNAAYTTITGGIGPSLSYINLTGSGSASAGGNISATDMPTGGSVIVRTTITYLCD